MSAGKKKRTAPEMGKKNRMTLSGESRDMAGVAPWQERKGEEAEQGDAPHSTALHLLPPGAAAKGPSTYCRVSLPLVPRN